MNVNTYRERINRILDQMNDGTVAQLADELQERLDEEHEDAEHCYPELYKKAAT
jgi:hypothetical protein